MSETAVPRTLADQFRSWEPAALVRLLTRRPDLANPAPQDSAQLASRAGTRASALRAVDQLDVLGLTVVDAAVALGGTVSVEDLHRHVNASAASVDVAVEELEAMALLWGAREQLRTLSVLSEIVGTTVSGLGPSAESLLASYGPNRVTSLAKDLGITPSGERQSDIIRITDHLREQENVDGLLSEIDPQARKILDHLEREGTEGTVESTERQVSRKDAQGPVDQLLSRGLLIARDRRHVAVPREVAICLRGGRTTRERVDVAPSLATSTRAQALVDRAAAGAAFEFVRHVELLLEHWGTTPPPALRGGGLGVRELRTAAELLHVDEATAALHIEVASAAGLVAVGHTEDLDAAWLPTDAFDVWTAAAVADRWARLALAWLENPRLTGLVGGRDENRKPVNALVADLERAWLPESRRMALLQLTDMEEGTVLAAGTGTASLVDRLKWLRPRRPAQRAQAIGWLVEEAAKLGVTGLGGMSAHGRALLADGGAKHDAPAALEPLLPEPVDHILLQADLTAVAPGPLEHELAHNLATMADIESRGGATVYRFTAQSVRRAFDSGWSAGEIHDFVAAASRTQVPQPLVYLVDDVSRKFGTVRVGTAEAFLRSDDEAALAELVHNPKAASLRLRRIAPTVVISDVPLDVLLPRLRELGTAPVVEAPDGTVRLARKDTHRARSPKHRPPVAEARLTARIGATVNAIRAGDEAAANRPTNAEAARLAQAGPMSTLTVLRESVETKSTVWIGYVDNHGATVERLVEPVKVEGGWLTAYDRRSDEVRSFAVHRIIGVSGVSVDDPVDDTPRTRRSSG
jgi:hypothetical protein